jgi:hypothetical protein
MLAEFSTINIGAGIINKLLTIQEYLQYSFAVNAIIVGVLIALCSSLLGVTLVLKRYSFIGDGLSHVAFGAMATASVMKLANQNLLILPVTVIVAIILLKSSQNAKIQGDAAIAMLSVSTLAFGYMIMNLNSTAPNVAGDVCVTLFGSISILTLTKSQVILCVVLSIAVITIFVVFYHKIFAVTFDENFFKATGVKTDRYNLLIAVIIALIIVLGMNLVGSLLISALVIFPALSAMRLIENFKGVIICSIIISVFCAFFGIITSMMFSTPVGSTIVMANLIVFILSCLIRKVIN